MSTGNSVYFPLPQSNSDSDGSSEEELHVSHGNRILNRIAKAQNSTGEKPCNIQKISVVNYKPLDNAEDVGAAFNKFQLSSDEVSILNPESGLEIFSTSRKICFVFSLLLCVFTTVAFLWILPCNVGSCPVIRNHNYTWETNLINLEIYGPINLVSDEKGNQNIVFLTKTALDSEQNFSESDLRCLKGKDGFCNWKIKFNQEPNDVDCELVDVNVDGFNDCLISGRNFLKAVNSLTGEEFWDVQKANKRKEKFYFSDFPLVLPDLDQDKVKEFLLPYSLGTLNGESADVDFQNYLVISGKTGIIISKPLQSQFFTDIHNLIFENSSTVTFTCFNSTKKESFKNIGLTKVYKTLKNVPRETINLYEWEKINQHEKDSDTVQVQDFRLILKNKGNCPEDCEVFVDVKDYRESSNNKTIYSFALKNTFGMAPIVLKTKKEFGFMLKFWSWHPKTEKFNSQNFDDFSVEKTTVKNNTKTTKRINKKRNHFINNSNVLDKEMLFESKLEFGRIKRTSSRLRKNEMKKSFLNSGNVNVNMIGEIVVKLSFNDSHILVSNITTDDIIQICKKSLTCQPNVFQHKHSFLVAKIDADGSEKLITYSSKYVYKREETKNKSKSWQIQSRIRVLNL